MSGDAIAMTTAQLIAKIGCVDFSASVFDVINQQIKIDHCTAFAVEDGEASKLLVGAATSGKKSTASQLADSYTAGAWAKDPIWDIVKLGTFDSPRIKLIDPKIYFNRNHCHEFYDKPGIEQEIAIIGQTDRIKYYFSFYRCVGEKTFSQHELDFFSILSLPLVHVVSKNRHVQEISSEPEISHDQMYDIVRVALLDEGTGLTEREAEICAGIVLGYSATALSLNMGISKNTVATHRKRAYAKLNICSQNELFSRYFAIISRGSCIAPEPGPAIDSITGSALSRRSSESPQNRIY